MQDTLMSVQIVPKTPNNDDRSVGATLQSRSS